MPIQWLNTNSPNSGLSYINTSKGGNLTMYISSPVVSVVTTGLVLSLDAGNLASYPGSGSTWTDTVQSRAFTLYSSPVYSSNNGGYLSFVPANSQYAASSTSLTSSLNTFTVETWHYYTGTNNGTAPCIITEIFPGNNSKINFFLGSLNAITPNLQSGYYDGAFKTTPTGYTLTANNWYHVVGTYDGSTVSLYVNNSLVQSSSFTGTPQSSQGGIRLMRRWDNPDYWGGNLAIANIYTGSLNSTQIQQNWTANRSRFGL